jgi:hypothetical protein
MPTAVEFDAGALKNAFLKIDTDFLKLSAATGDTFLKIEDSGQFKHDVSVIGNFFLKLDNDFLKIADTALKIDSLVVKLNPMVSFNSDTGLSAVQSDFLKLDTVLKTSAGNLGTLGVDFLKLDAAPNLAALKLDELKVSNDFLKVGGDMSDAGAAFVKLGDDLIKLGDGLDHKLQSALNLVGGELLKVGAAFDALARDDHKLSLDFKILAGGNTDANGLGASFTFADVKHVPTSGLGADFYKLEQDFLVLNRTLSSVDVEKLLGAFSGADIKLNDPGNGRMDQLPSGHGGSIFDHG